MRLYSVFDDGRDAIQSFFDQRRLFFVFECVRFTSARVSAPGGQDRVEVGQGIRQARCGATDQGAICQRDDFMFLFFRLVVIFVVRMT